MDIRALIARGRRTEREDALSSEARAFLLFCQIAEREGLEKAQQIYRRIAAVTSETINPKRPPRNRRKGSSNLRNLFNVQVLTLWKVWKSQNPAGNEEQFERWFKEWPGRSNIKGGPMRQERSLARWLKRNDVKPTSVLAQPAKPARSPADRKRGRRSR